MRASLLLPLSLSLLLLAPLPARAQGEDTRVAAEALFGEGRALFKKEDYAAACAKFAESNRLDPAIGTEFNLADCEEHRGHLATSWALWRRVVDRLSSRPSDVRYPIAREHVAALDPRLPRLAITLAAGAPAASVVRLDGLMLASGALGAAIPVDPGAHAIAVGADGRAEGRTDVTLAEGEQRAIAVAPGEATAPPTDPATHADPTRRTIAAFVAGAGVVGLGLGTAFGLTAKSRYDDATARCPSAAACDPTAQAQVDRARSAGNVSTLAFVAGGALVATGAVLWLTAPRVAVTPRVDARSAGLSIVGRFE